MELADCGHLFEVEMMDQWMDQAQASDDGKAVDVQLKRCPKCSTPIRTSLRYGNIIKKILADFERIKKKILLGEEKRTMEVNRMRVKVQNIEKFPEDQEKLQKALCLEDLTSEQVNVYENQISFLSFLQTIKANIEKCMDAESERATRHAYFLQETKENVESLVEQLRTRVMEVRIRFSDQELEELSEEMYRMQLAVELKLLKMQLKVRGLILDVTFSMKVDEIQKALDSERKIGNSL